MDKTTFQDVFNIEKLSAIVTWSVVSGSALYLMHRTGEVSLQRLTSTGLLYCLFLVSWIIGIREKVYRRDTQVRLVSVTVQYLAILGVFFMVPYTYSAILVVIWSAQIAYYMPVRRAILLSPLWSAPMWMIYSWYWDQSFVLLSAALFWTFNLFALVMVNATIQEKKAREAANELNRELLAAQALLSEASKQAERVRIARNIHDLLGHHLTALSINLQVASHLTEGEAHEKVEQCHGLATLLLSDVREAVSEIREKSNLELKAAIEALANNVPQMRVDIAYGEDVVIDDVQVADTLLRCVQEAITNSVRHGRADRFSIDIREQQRGLILDMKDNGQGTKQVIPGNGLKGMQERVRQLGGQIRFSVDAQGFETHIHLPEAV